MLKVNLKKISLEEFVKKYSIMNKNPCTRYDLQITDKGEICIQTIGFWPDTADKTLSLLYDMIKSRDVIKEENKNDA